METLFVRRGRFLSPLLALATAVLTGCSQQQAFNSPDLAADALVAALRDGSPDRLNKVLGLEGEDTIASGDPVADRIAADKFLKAYDEKHRFTSDGDNQMTLVVGNNDWPLPIPLVKDQVTGWHFDGKAGKEEIVNRRIGRNELDVITVCQSIVDAQRDYMSVDRNGDGVRSYAVKFLSDTGKKNGLYWPTAEGEAPSPLGPLVADAEEEGYRMSPNPTNETRPFHGYCYKMLTAQGPNAEDGAIDYMVNGKLVRGFAVVAYPADYGNSGIMTFIVSNRGVVFQRNLGAEMTKVAKAMTVFDPGPGWEAIAFDTGSSAKH